MVQRVPINANYLTVIRGLLEIHRLTKEGKFESSEADAIRDAMDSLWEGLSEAERDKIRDLSETLNAISETPVPIENSEFNPGNGFLPPRKDPT